MSYLQNKLFLSIALQRCCCKMKISIIVDVIIIRFLPPMIDNFLWIIVEKYQASTWGPHVFATIKKFWFFALNAKDLSKNIIWMILSQRSSKSIAANTFYTRRGIVRYIYYDNRQVGHILYYAQRCGPHVPHGVQMAPREPGIKTRHYGVPMVMIGCQMVFSFSFCTFDAISPVISSQMTLIHL